MAVKLCVIAALAACSAAKAHPNAEQRIYTNASSQATPEDLEKARRLGYSGRRLEMTDALRTALLNKHNALRSAQSVPCTAANMPRLEWDTALETASTSYSQLCQWWHDPTNGANSWGENLAYQWSSNGLEVTESLLVGMVQAWYDEIDDTEWNNDYTIVNSVTYADPQSQCKSYDATDGNCMIGHYTQVVAAKSSKVGCGVTNCQSGLIGNKGGVYLVCKYQEPGNTGGDGGLQAPYAIGATCSACPTTCQDHLCTCPDSMLSCVDWVGPGATANGYSSCTDLLDPNQGGFSCSFLREQRPHWCPLTCGDCQEPAGLGASQCGATKYESSNTCDGQPGTTTTASDGASQTTQGGGGDGGDPQDPQSSTSVIEEGSLSGSSSATCALPFSLLFLAFLRTVSW
mmetsp:Transcript_15999/g.37725  ORF Transcript_15999/g.37725 Transcript_15999/m.37725 type:complete len:402 (+) Transcript_15999:56-1261(+)|eukprot:CAMPEP_0178414598 /NCGR_PEP_ID=MMETSP0689_2-20121128/23117_1 /TAXON_ID=160604 /ORGANISM="Amphidinium massartii, Strain CS-259" /LENGTH=401 /DNA_ID=CAMNT_0020035889 /DNA_START=56 /DNA_END=1261 /DNA_ORIENTATION=-